MTKRARRAHRAPGASAKSAEHWRLWISGPKHAGRAPCVRSQAWSGASGLFPVAGVAVWILRALPREESRQPRPPRTWLPYSACDPFSRSARDLGWTALQGR